MVRLKLDAGNGGTLVDDVEWTEIAANREEYWKSGLLPRRLKAPLLGVWEITGRCNLRCVYCYNDSPRTPPDLNWSVAERLAEDLIRMKVFAFCVSGGEPTLHPHYTDILKILCQGGISVGTITNGSTMTPELARTIAAYASTVQVSVDGPTAEEHDLVRRQQGSFDRAVRAIRMLREAGAREISVSFAGTRLNVDSFQRMPELCVELGVVKLRTQPLSMIGRADGDADLEPTPEQADRLKEFIAASQGKYGDLKMEWGDPSVHVRVGLALGMSLIVRITNDGNFGLSPYYPIFFGNACQSSLAEVWERGLRVGWGHQAVRDLFQDTTHTPVLRTPPGLAGPLHVTC